MEQFVRFFQNQQPPLKSGKYSVSISQDIEIKDGTKLGIEDAEFNFVVFSEQISMNPGLVYSVFPPNQSAAAYDNCFPHIVLNRKTLPWERQLFKDDEEFPWLCLLVFSQDENVISQSSDYYTAKTAEDNIFVPVPETIANEPAYIPDSEQCSYIDIPYDVFEKVLPSKNNLKYLSHVKLVSLDDKVTDDKIKDGWFSCVVSDRHPKKVTGDEPVRHTAHLVTLEGFSGYLTERNKKNVNDKDIIRMFALAGWEFFCLKDNIAFKKNAENLEAGVFMPELKYDNKDIEKLVNLGYSAVNHNMRDGTAAVSWYRPPLIPLAPEDENSKKNYYFDELLKYDKDLGMFDISYQSAWQLGRLLAFSDKEFIKQLISWRLQTKQKLALEQTKMIINSKLDKNGDTDELLRNEWINIANELIEECGTDNCIDLKSMENFESILKKLKSESNREITLDDLIKVYEQEEI